MAIPYLACMALVASLYQLPPRVLPSLQVVEGGRVGLVHRNENSSEDLGLMQINTVWIPVLSEYTGRSPAEVRGLLIGSGCYNIAAAGAILRIYLNEAHENLMMAIGYYHSHNSSLGVPYQQKVKEAARRLFSRLVQSQSKR